MGGTDFIENPGPYRHRNSRKAPHLGVLSREESSQSPADLAPFEPNSVPLYAEGLAGPGKESARAPRWRGG